MYTVDLYLRVRLACHVDGLSQREAASRFGIARETVRKMLGHSEPPGYRRRQPPKRPKLDPFRDIIDRILDRTVHCKQRHTAKRIFERLRDEHGFAGKQTIVKDYVRERRRRQREMFVPLAHPPGHAQADFGEADAIIAGVKRRAHFFAMDLPHSDACFVAAYPAAATEAWLDGHNGAFAFFGGIPQSILYDNDKCLVSRILPDDAGGDLPAASGDATSKSAVSRRFVALTRSKLKAWLASPLDDLDLVVLQIDGLHVGDHLMVAAIGIDTGGAKHVLGLAEGATENAATVQAMLDNLIERGLDPERPRLYIVDGAKALSKAIRRTFGRAAALQRCQVHKGRNITDRLDESLHAGVRKVLRQAWQQDDAAKAERLLRNLARRLEHDAPGVSGSILEGLDEILTVIRLGLPPQLRRSLACTNAIENAIGTVRTVQRNVKRWRNAEMALRWTAAGLLEAQKTFRRLKAYRQLPVLDAALREAVRKAGAKSVI